MRAGLAQHPFVAAINQRIFYGWLMLAAAALGIFASGPGQSHTFSVFVGPIGRDLDLSATAIASAYGIATLAASFGLPLMGRLVDRFGVRRMLVVVAALLGTACLLFSQVTGMASLAIGFAALRFLGQGSLMLNCANLVSQWFHRQRGFALGLMMLGFAASMAVHPVLGTWLGEQFGWRSAYVVLGLLTWVILLPVFILFVRHKPEEVGLLPDGRPPAEDDAPPAAETGIDLRTALRMPAFYIIAAGLFLMSMLATALHFFQVSIFESQGLDREIAAGVFTISAVAMVVTMPLIGRLLDLLPTRPVFAVGLCIQSGSLIAITFASDLTGAVVYGVMFGLNNAMSLSLLSYLWPRFFGRRHLGSIQGTGQMLTVIGASLGPLPLGLAHDLFSGYGATLYVLALLPVLSALSLLLLPPPPLYDQK